MANGLFNINPIFTPAARTLKAGQLRRESESLSPRAFMGDEDALASLAIINPQAAQQAQALMNQKRTQERQDKMLMEGRREKIANFMQETNRILGRSQDPEEMKQILQFRINEGEQLYGPEFGQIADALQGERDIFDVASIRSKMGIPKDDFRRDSVQKSEILEDGTTVQVLKSGLTRVTDPQGNELTGDERIEALTEAKRVGVEEQKKRSGARTAGKKITERQQGFINAGIEAADSLATIKRSVQLLDDVETGGIDAALLRGKQVFGIESANEAELSAGLGKSILAQLKPIFGAAFTAQEGQRLERIEANFGKSTEGNKRLLKQLEKIVNRAANRGLRAAESAEDSFTAGEIRDALDFDLDDTPQAQGKPQQPTQPELSEEEMAEYEALRKELGINDN